METTIKQILNQPKLPNRQLYENSQLQELFNDPATAPAKSNGFFNQREPNLAILHEKPEHRLLLMLKCRGLSNNEIAAQSGYTVPWISQLMRQPWAVKLMSELMTQAGVDEVQTMLKAECLPSLQTLVSLRDDSKVSGAVRAGCANSLVDRWLGKPTQNVKVESSYAEGGPLDAQEIDKQLAELERKVAEGTGQPFVQTTETITNK